MELSKRLHLSEHQGSSTKMVQCILTKLQFQQSRNLLLDNEGESDGNKFYARHLNNPLILLLKIQVVVAKAIFQTMQLTTHISWKFLWELLELHTFFKT